MCGRFVRSSPREIVCDEFEAVATPDVDFAPRYNLCPGDAVLAVAGGASRRVGRLRWGLVPSFAKDPRGGPRAINARAETVHVRPVFRAAFRHRRCVIVADGFYEWRREGGQRVPFLARPRDTRPMAFAGVWERWRGDDGQELTTCAIVTCPANADLAPVHDRMPVILDRGAWRRWLAPGQDPEALLALLCPYVEGALEVYEVSRLVNSPRNDVPECTRSV